MRVTARKVTTVGGSSSSTQTKNAAKILSPSNRSDTVMTDDERFEMAVGDSISPKKKKKERKRPDYDKKKSKVSRSIERSGKSMRYMAEVIKRSLNRSNQSSGSFSGGNGTYAISLPSGVTKDVRGSALAILLAMSMRDLFAHMTEEDVEQLRKENTNTAEEKVLSSETVEMIEAKTEVGGSKLVPKYRKGTSVLYKTQQDIIGVLILDVHMDDLLEPYYTIKLPDGKEKQTDNAHLMLPDTEKVVVNDILASEKETVKKDVTKEVCRPLRTTGSKARSKGDKSSSSRKSDKRKVNNSSNNKLSGQSSSKDKNKSQCRQPSDPTTKEDNDKVAWGIRRKGRKNSLRRLAKTLKGKNNTKS